MFSFIFVIFFFLNLHNCQITTSLVLAPNKQKKSVCDTHEELSMIFWKKVGMTLSLHGRYELGHARVTMTILIESKVVR